VKYVKVFLAAPLFSEAEREFNSKIAKRLRENGFEVWLAQEAPFIEQGTHREKKMIYEGDISALKSSDVVVAVLDGAVVDAGVAYEMGYAKALGKPVLGLKTDHRTFSRMEEVNLMLEVPLTKICKSLDNLIDLLGKIR
jgi:nucleoside 2-deoxyribosyltransferase